MELGSVFVMFSSIEGSPFLQFGSVPFRPEDHPNFQPTSAGSFHSQPMQPYPIYPGPPGNFPPMMEPYGFNHMVQPGQMPHNLYQNFPGYSHPTQFNQNRAQQTPPRPYAPRVDNKPKPNLAKPQPNPKSPEAQKKRILTLTNPNTKEVVDLRKSPGEKPQTLPCLGGFGMEYLQLASHP